MTDNKKISKNNKSNKVSISNVNIVKDKNDIRINTTTEEEFDNLIKIFGSNNKELSIRFVETLIESIGGNIEEKYIKSALAFMEEMKPQDSMESMLLIQSYATHMMACQELHSSNSSNITIQMKTERINRITKLTRTFMSQIEALKKYRSNNAKIGNINVNDGGQAVINSNIKK
jgi:GH15 family glucan-1,4-alpha-glucosidase